MNHREMKSAVYSFLGDPAEDRLQFGEVVRCLNIGQSVFAGELFNVERGKILGIYKQTSTSGTADYATAADLREIVRVMYAGVDCKWHPPSQVSAFTKVSTYRPIKGTQQFFHEVGAVAGVTQVRLYPTPDTTVADEVEQWYYKRPLEFHEQGSVESTASANGTTTTLIDTKVPFNTSAKLYTGFWTNSVIRFTSGSNNGIYRRVTTWDPTTSKFTFDALPTATASGDSFEIDQISILPDQHHHFICYYAAGILAHKVGMDGAKFMSMFERELERIRQKWIGNVEVNIAGDLSNQPSARVS